MTKLGITIFFRSKQLTNTDPSIRVTELGISIFVKETQCAKVSLDKYSKLLDKITFFRVLQL